MSLCAPTLKAVAMRVLLKHSGRNPVLISDWLHSIDAVEYHTNFEEHDIKTMEDLRAMEISEKDLKSALGIRDILTRKRMALHL
eukprot:SAG31_NODE_3542_length_4143_cov_2.092977_5_plen_84_part_00